MVRFGSSWSRRREIVVLPAPEGEDRTSISPRRWMCDGSAASAASIGRLSVALLNVLHLLAELLDDGLQVQADTGQLQVAGLGADRVRLAVQLLAEEVEPAADRLPRGEQFLGRADVGAQTIDLLLDVGLRRQQGDLLGQAILRQCG